MTPDEQKQQAIDDLYTTGGDLGKIAMLNAQREAQRQAQADHDAAVAAYRAATHYQRDAELPAKWRAAFEADAAAKAAAEAARDEQLAAAATEAEALAHQMQVQQDAEAIMRHRRYEALRAAGNPIAAASVRDDRGRALVEAQAAHAKRVEAQRAAAEHNFYASVLNAAKGQQTQ